MSDPELAAESPIRLLIADDHPVVRDGLSAMFARDPGFEVLGEARDGAEAVKLAQALEPDVILMDLRMPGMDGLAAITELARRGVPARVLVLTTYDTDSYVLPAIEAGATGYMLKDAPRAELLRAVRAAAQGQAVLSPAVTARLMSRVRAPGAGPLSQRELEVLELVAAGKTNREAAARLFITEATVKTHLLNIYAKLGVGDRAAAHGQAVLSPAVTARLMSRVRTPSTGPLSQRELEVLELVASGKTNREAAARLFITEATVKTHLLNIYAKLGVGDRAAAVAEAFNRGLLTPGTTER